MHPLVHLLLLIPTANFSGMPSFADSPYKQGMAVWITQLVVHTAHRHKKVATAMLQKACLKNDVAWGIATSNPYGVRALERAVSKKMEPEKIVEQASALVKASRIDWFQNCKLTVDTTQSIIHANFYVDHTTVNIALDNQVDWRLGRIGDGDEFFAFCFNEH